MTIRPIRNDADHRMALARIEELWNSEPGTPEDDEFDVLSVLVSDSEQKRWPILPPDPVDARPDGEARTPSKLAGTSSTPGSCQPA